MLPSPQSSNTTDTKVNGSSGAERPAHNMPASPSAPSAPVRDATMSRDGRPNTATAAAGETNGRKAGEFAKDTASSDRGAKRSHDEMSKTSTSTDASAATSMTGGSRPVAASSVTAHAPSATSSASSSSASPLATVPSKAVPRTSTFTAHGSSPSSSSRLATTASASNLRAANTSSQASSKPPSGAARPPSTTSTTARPTPPASTTSSTAARATPPKAGSSSTSSAAAAAAPFLGIHDLEAVAQAAMGLDANGNPLPGNEESHRALAEAVKRLSAAQNGTAGDGFARAQGNYVQHAEDDPDGPAKRFQCHMCDRAFARAYNLNTHLATHDPDPSRSKPFPCPYPSCKADGGRSFSRKHDLQRHVASTHENEPEPGDDGEVDENGQRVGGLASLGLGTPGRKFRCDDCGRAFVRRDALKRHQCVPMGSPGSSVGAGGASAGGAGSGRYASPSTPRSALDTAPDSPFSGGMPSGLSLYTSTGPQPTASSGGGGSGSGSSHRHHNGSSSAYDSNAPFYPNGITYENLTKEVEDMAMQLVAQATSYNEKHSSSKGKSDEKHKSLSSSKTQSIARPPK